MPKLIQYPAWADPVPPARLERVTPDKWFVEAHVLHGGKQAGSCQLRLLCILQRGLFVLIHACSVVLKVAVLCPQ